MAGIDFQENFASVRSDVTFRMLLIDVKTAFFHGKLEEEIFLKWPEGYTEYQSQTQNVEEKIEQVNLWTCTSSKRMVKTFIEVLTNMLDSNSLPTTTVSCSERAELD